MTACPVCGRQNDGTELACSSCGHGEEVLEPPNLSYWSGLPWHTRRFLVLFYGATIVASVAEFIGWSDAAFLLSVACGFLAAWWVITDASDRGHRVRFGVRLLVILFGGIASFFYLIFSRKLRGLGWFLLHSTAYVAIILVPELLAAMLSS